MPEKMKTVYVCIKCGKKSDKFRNACPRCGSAMAKHTIVE
jgi:DNA-directed RNA polymerase subunit RPC12/RpoP